MKAKNVLAGFSLLLLAGLGCKKYSVDPVPPPPEPAPKILLKDILMPNLPSPYYHFEYGADSLVTHAGFASGYTNYDVIYQNGRISEMRNNIIVNHDTLRYFYNQAGQVAEISFIDQNNILYRHVKFTYSGQQPSRIEWDHRNSNMFLVDRQLDFSYHPDGNVKSIHEFRPAFQGTPAIDFTTHYDEYDDKRNVDDYTLIHDGIHDHFLILPGLHLQKNNARKEWQTGSGNEYTVNYTFQYRADGSPSFKSGTLLFTSGSQAGLQFMVSTSYSYY